MRKLSVCSLLLLLTIAAYANVFHGTHYLTGSINDKYGIDMNLDIEGQSCTGTYQYTSQTSKLSLNGTVDNTGKVTLHELDPNGKKTGVFRGQVRMVNGLMQIEGTWSTPDGATVFPFSVSEPGC